MDCDCDQCKSAKLISRQSQRITELEAALETQKDDNRNLADQVNRMADDRDRWREQAERNCNWCKAVADLRTENLTLAAQVREMRSLLQHILGMVVEPNGPLYGVMPSTFLDSLEAGLALPATPSEKYVAALERCFEAAKNWRDENNCNTDNECHADCVEMTMDGLIKAVKNVERVMRPTPGARWSK